MSAPLEGVSYPREVPPPAGIPKGWKCIERQYGPNAKTAGQVYTRYSCTHDGHHAKMRGVCTPKQVIMLDGEFLGYDWEPVFDEYARLMRDRQEQEKEDRRKAAEEAGVLKGQDRENAIERFKDSFGPLSGPQVAAFPGWKTRWDYAASCNQVHVTYTEPTGRAWKLLKDIEARMGFMMVSGEEEKAKLLTMIEVARANADPSTFSEGSKIARDQIWYEAEAPMDAQVSHVALGKQLEPARKKIRTDLGIYEDCNIVVADAGDAPSPTVKKGLQTLGADDGGSLAAAAGRVRARLENRGFGIKPGLVVVFRASGEITDNKLAQAITGVYFKIGDVVNGRPAFQHVSEADGLLKCKGCYLFWNSEAKRWQFGQLDEKSRPRAYVAVDVANPIRQQLGEAPWRLLKQG